MFSPPTCYCAMNVSACVMYMNDILSPVITDLSSVEMSFSCSVPFKICSCRSYSVVTGVLCMCTILLIISLPVFITKMM